MLSVHSQGHVYTSPLTHTLSHFAENLSTRPPSINQTSTKLHCVVSALSHQELLPSIAHFLRLSPRKSALRNLGIGLANYHPKQCRRFLRIPLNLYYPQANTSSLSLVNQRVWPTSDPKLHSSNKLHKSYQHAFLHWLNKLQKQERKAPTARHCTISENCIVMLVCPPSSWLASPPKNCIVFLY